MSFNERIPCRPRFILTNTNIIANNG